MPPTLLALAGFDVPKRMQGADLSSVALGKTTKGPDAVLLQIFVPFNPDAISTPWRGIITDRYTYARFEKDSWVLFDNRTDPWQTNNLAADPQHAALAKQLDARLAAMMKAKGDSWSVNSSELVEEGGRLYKHQTFYTVQDYLNWAKTNPDQAK
jgi:arylsulfatase A-like enzyme